MVKASELKVSSIFEFDPKVKSEAGHFFQLAKSAQTILISSTLTSDGDSVGAQLGLYGLLKELRGSDQGIVIVDHSPVPHRYSFLDGASRIMTLKEFESKKISKTFDLGITLDGGIERTGDVAPLFANCQKTALIDHHAVGSQRKYDATLLDLSVSSTCELIYLLYEEAGFSVTKAMAACLYVGIVFDTGFFKHSLTTPRTHLVAARLISTGIDFSNISDRAILERSWEAQLLLKSLLDNMQKLEDGRIIMAHWKKSEIDAIGPKDGDQEGMINQLYFTETAEVVALLTEISSEEVKVSFRSKGKINVAELARQLNPDGGGHMRAAGCHLDLSLLKAQELIQSKLKEAVRGK